MKRKVIFINSHPIQYFAPLYKYMNERAIVTEAWYCSDESVKGSIDGEFGVSLKWDIPLLEGYQHKFFKNYSWKPSAGSGFFGLINPGIILQLFKEPKSVIVVHGWHYCTHLLVLLLGKIRGHTICLRYETPQKQEALKKGWKQAVKKVALKHLVFPRASFFLYIGRQNRLLYQEFGVSDSRLAYCPYAVDNQRFKTENHNLRNITAAIKNKLGIPMTDKVILFSGKYIEKKRPLDLLKAFAKLNVPDCWLIFVGEGELRKEMQEFIIKNKLKQVILTGFVNQSAISRYYAISDVFVMSSGVGETWGLSVNEAMNFNLPIILSDLTGCSEDLVKNGDNGYVYKTGDIEELTLKLRQILVENTLTLNVCSEKLVENYSYDVIVKSIAAINNK